MVDKVHDQDWEDNPYNYEGSADNIVVFCAECGRPFEVSLDLFEAADGDDCYWYCTSCSGDDLLFTSETMGVLDA